MGLIAHVDIDAFFASVEQVRNPRLAGKPVIVGNGVVASCSYEARKFGCRAAMSLRKARQLCPQAIVLDGDHNVYVAFAEQVWEILAGFSPGMETLLDDAYLDLAGTERLNGPPGEMARRLKALVRERTGLTATCGIASSRVVARMASASGKPDGLVVVPPGGEEAFLRDKPVEKLPGVGPATAEVLRRLNLATLGQIAALPPGSLEAILGKVGSALHERAQGRDSRVVGRSEIPKSVSRESAFHVETCDRREIEAMLYYLTERAARTLRDLGVAAKTVSVKVRMSDFTGETASRSLAHASDQDDELYGLARGLLSAACTRRVSLRGVGVVLSNIRAAGELQPDLFDGGARVRRARLYRTLDEVRRRYGYGALIAGRSFELVDRLEKNDHGFVLRTPSLTK
jgi:DNA polymerase-4